MDEDVVTFWWRIREAWYRFFVCPLLGHRPDPGFSWPPQSWDNDCIDCGTLMTTRHARLRKSP